MGASDRRQRVATRGTRRTKALAGALLTFLLLAVGFAWLEAQPSDAAATCTKTWVGVSGASFDTAANWDPVGVPAAADYACISGLSVAVPSSRTIAGIRINGSGSIVLGTGANLTLTSAVDASELDGGLVDGAGTLTVNGSLLWSSGTMQGSGSTVVGAAATMTVSSPSGTASFLSVRSLVNQGHVFQSSESGNGLLVGALGSVVNPGTWDLADDGAGIINWDGNAGPVVNTGTIRKTAGTGTSIINIPLNGGGTVNVAAGGTVALGGGGAPSGAVAFSGPGTVDVTGGTYVTAAGTTVSGSGRLSVSGSGVLSVSGATTVASGSTLAVDGGSIDGAGTVTVNGSLLWSSGTMQGTGQTVVGSGGTMTVTSPPGTASFLLARTLVNQGQATQSSASGNGILVGALGSIVNSGTWDFVDDAAGITNWDGNPGPVVNSGSIRKTAGTGTNIISIPLNGNGTVSAAAGGTVALAAGGSSSGAVTFSGAGTVAVTGGTFTTAAGTNVSGSGRLSISGTGVFSVGGATTVGASSTFALEGGFVDGAGTLTVNGSLVWSSGTMQGSGQTVVGPAATMTVTSPGGTASFLLVRTLVNQGHATQSSASGNGILVGALGSVVNSGTWDFADDTAGIINWDGNPGSFANSGTIRKTAGTGTNTVSIAASNSGTSSVSVAAGTIALSAGGSINGAVNLAGSGTLALTGGTFTTATGATVTGAGRLTVSNTGVWSVESATTVAAASTFALDGGFVDGAGTLTVNGSFLWSSGSMQGSGSTVVGSGATLTMTSPPGTASFLIGRSLVNQGHATQSSASGNGLLVGGQGTVVNSGTWDFVDDVAGIANWDGNPGPVLNSGTIRKTTGTGTNTISIPLTNSGTISIAVATGTINAGSTYTQTATGNLVLEATNAAPGGYARLTIQDVADLAGTLTLHTTFVPGTGDGFTAVTGQQAFTDQFDSVVGTGSASGTTFTFDSSDPFAIVARVGSGPAPMVLGLAPASSTNPVNATYTATATATRAGVPQSGTNVTFLVASGPNAGDTTTVATGGAGQATFTYSSTQAGTDTIGASALDGATTVNAPSVTATWTVTPTLPLAVSMTADDSAVAPGAATGYTITVTNPNSAAAALDSISASLPAGFTYVPGSSTGATTTDPLVSGSDLGWAVPVNIGASSSVTLHLGVTAGSTPGTFTASADATATGGLTVTPSGPSAPITVAAPGTLAITLAPASDSNPVGDDYTATATVTRDGVPQPGVDVAFTVLSGPNTGQTATVASDAAGEATFTYTSATAGTDTLAAQVEDGPDVVMSNSVSVIWTTAATSPLTVTIVADDSSVGPGGATGYTVTITNPNASTALVDSISVTLPAGFAYVPGSSSGVTVTDPSVAASTLTWSAPVSIGATGSASLHFGVAAGSTPGTFNASADATATGGLTVTPSGPSAPVTVTAGPGPLVISLAPATASNPVGASSTATATVTRDGAPQSGVTVSFSVTAGPNAGQTGTAATDGAGHAAFTFSSTLAGTDTISASAPDGPATVTATPVTATWTAAPTGGLTVTASSDPVTVTAGQSVRQTFVVTNTGTGAVTNAGVVLNLPAGSAIVSSTPTQGTCTPGTATVSCSLGTIAVGASATVQVVASVPAAFPPGPFTASATASSDQTGTVDPGPLTGTDVVAATPGEAAGFVAPGGTIDTGTATAANPTAASFTLPATGPGAPIELTVLPTTPTFCGGQSCVGALVNLSPFTGYTNPNQPAVIDLILDQSLGGSSATNVYVLKENQTDAKLVPNSATSKPTRPPGKGWIKIRGSWYRWHHGYWHHHHWHRGYWEHKPGGSGKPIASPSPCVSRRFVDAAGDSHVEMLILSGDPRFGRR